MSNYLGGQALIEGVMIKNKDKISIAIRTPKNKIITSKEKIKFKETKIPFIRGIINLFVILYIGIKALTFSSNIQMGTDEKFSTKEIIFTIFISIIFALIIFKLIPLSLTYFLDKQFNLNNIIFSVIEGIFKIFIFVLYVYVISFSTDVYRIFQYHGAEHKAVRTYESKEKLTISNVQKHSTIHERCGTAFIFLVLFVSIVIYVFIPKNYSFLTKLLLRVLLLPIIAGISYELLRFGAKYKFMRIFNYPGMLIQKITTKEPDDKQVEVAIKAVKNALN